MPVETTRNVNWFTLALPFNLNHDYEEALISCRSLSTSSARRLQETDSLTLSNAG